MSSMADRRDNNSLEEDANDRSGNMLSDTNTLPEIQTDPMENRNIEGDPKIGRASCRKRVSSPV